MSGGYWGKGNNPFFNYDFEAASKDRENHNLKAAAHRDKLDADMQISSLREEINSSARRMRSARIHQDNLRCEMQEGCFKLAIRSNIFQRTLTSLMDNHPEIKALIMKEINKQYAHCYSESYQQTWSKWASEFKNNPNHYDAYFTFPFPVVKEDQK